MDASLRTSPGCRTRYVADGPMTMHEFLSVAFRHRWKVLAIAILAPAISIGLAFALPKTYRAHSDLLIKSGHEYLPQANIGNSAAAPTTSKQEDITSEMTILGSRAVVEATIDAIGLARLFPDLAENPPTNMSRMDAAVEAFGQSLSIEPVKMSNIISVSYDATTSAQAKLAADTLIATYIEKHAQVFSGSRAEGYGDAAGKSRAELEAAQAHLSRIKLDHGVFDVAAQRGALIAQRVDAENHLHAAIDRQATLQQRLAYLTAQRPRVADTLQSTITDRNDVSNHAHEALTSLRQAEAELAARYGDANPDLQRIRSQIGAIKGVASGMGSSRVNVSTLPSPLAQAMDQELVMDTAELAPLEAEIGRYRTLHATLDADLRSLEQADLDVRTTNSRIDVLTDSYKAAQARYEQARTEEQTQLAREVSVVPIAPAIASDKAVKPKKLIFAAGGLLAGLLGAGAIVLFGMLTDQTLATEDAAERLIGLPVLASLPMRKRGVRSTVEVG